MLDTGSLALIDLLQRKFGAEHPELTEQLKEVAEEHERSGKPLLEVIENYGLFSRKDMLELMADDLGTEIWNPRAADVPKEVVDLIDEPTARGYGFMPVAFDGETIKAICRDPYDYQTIESMSFLIGHPVTPLVADRDDVDAAIERYYPEHIDSVNDIISEMEVKENSGDEDIRELEDQANDAPIIKFVDAVMMQAIRDQASDIHFEPFENVFRIRYRVDGALYEMPPPPKALAIPVISRVKIISGLNISERRKPQDGRIQLKVGGKPVDLRVSCLPTSYGESVVLRVLDRSVVNLDLDALGLSQEILDGIRQIIQQPNGILLVTGPTGSGKTTTLYSALGEINRVEDKLLTAEDPVEYDIEGIMQVPINDAVGMTFQKALRAFLRQDPDRILVGEIRDFETAQIAIEASLTRHFVFSTLHTNDSASTIVRLVDMGLEPFLICSSLSAVLSQRLIRRVCKNCKAEYVPSDEELDKLGMTRKQLGDRKFSYGKGCPKCNNTGYKGRKAIVELMFVDSKIRELIADGAPMEVIRETARANGMRTLREDGIHAVLNGETTVDEILRYTL